MAVPLYNPTPQPRAQQNMGVSPEQIAQMLAAQQAQLKLQPLEAQIAQAEKLRQFQAPKGRSHGQNYAAANPLEFLGGMMQSYAAGNEADRLNKQAAALRETVGTGAGAEITSGLSKEQAAADLLAQQSDVAAQNEAGAAQYDIEQSGTTETWEDPKNPNVPITTTKIGSRHFDNNGNRVNVDGLKPFKEFKTGRAGSGKSGKSGKSVSPIESTEAANIFKRVVTDDAGKDALGFIGSPDVAASAMGTLPKFVDVKGINRESASKGKALRIAAEGLNLDAIAPRMQRLGAPMSDADVKTAKRTAPKVDDNIDTWLTWGEKDFIPALDRALVKGARDGSITPEAIEYVAEARFGLMLGKLVHGRMKPEDLTTQQIDALDDRQAAELEEILERLGY